MKKCQRIVSIILVISMMMTSSSFAAFADSVDETITATDDIE